MLHLMPESMPYVAVGLKVDVAYLDFRKAFDTVDVVLSKLVSFGCTTHTLNFSQTIYEIGVSTLSA